MPDAVVGVCGEILQAWEGDRCGCLEGAFKCHVPGRCHRLFGDRRGVVCQKAVCRRGGCAFLSEYHKHTFPFLEFHGHYGGLVGERESGKIAYLSCERFPKFGLFACDAEFHIHCHRMVLLVGEDIDVPVAVFLVSLVDVDSVGYLAVRQVSQLAE